jgi:hypothetical protein
LLAGSLRSSARGVTVSFAIALVTAIPLVSGAQAAPPPKKTAASPPPRAVTVRAAPRVVAPRSNPPVRNVTVAKPVTQPQNINRNVGVNNTNLQRGNTNLQRGNTNVQLRNLNNPNLQNTNQNLVRQQGVFQAGGNQLQHGPGKVNFTPLGLKAGPGGLQQVKPAFAAVNINNRFWPITKVRNSSGSGASRGSSSRWASSASR